MKKIFLFAIGLLFAGSVSAQNYYGPPHHDPRRHTNRNRYDDFYQPKIGLEVGMNIANTLDYYNPYYGTNSLIGVNAGLTFEMPVSYPFSLVAEVLYSQKGYKGFDGTTEFTQRTHYIDVPLLAKFRIVKGFNFLVGTQLTFPVSTTNTYYGYNSSYQNNYYDYGSKSYLAGVIGVSFDLNKYVDLHGRYAIDFGSNYSAYGNSYLNQVWQVGLGIRIK